MTVWVRAGGDLHHPYLSRNGSHRRSINFPFLLTHCVTIGSEFNLLVVHARMIGAEVLLLTIL